MTSRLVLAVCLLFGPVVSTDGSCRRAISFAQPIITSGFITSAGYGDFNEDGLVDVALMRDSVRIIAVNRGGVFQPMPHEDLFTGSSSGFEAPIVAVTDVNGDSHLDLLYRRYNTIW